MFELLHAVYERLTAGGSTKEQAIQSGIWATFINVGDRVLQLLKVIILARLLSPKAFGLLGIALLSIAALREFSELGFDQALVQHNNEDIDSYLNTLWMVKIIRGSIIAVVAILVAPHLAVFFGEPQATELIQLIGISPLILGLQNPAVVYFQKNLNFHKEFIYKIGGRFIDLSVAVVIAIVFRSVWALAAGIVAMNLVKSALSYAIHKYRPSVEFNLNSFNYMFSFGKWMFASSILVFIYGQGDDAFIGWFFTATSLGFYQIAYRFSNAPATEVTQIISRVAFPAFSKVQNDVDRLRKGFLRTVQLSTVIGFPMAAGIAAVAPQFVNAVLGNQWNPMVPLIQALAVWGGLRAFGANVGAVYKSVGRPDIEVRVQALKVLVIALTIYPAAEHFGILGVATVIVGSTFITLPIHIHIVLSIVDGDITELLRIILYPIIASISMFTLVRGFDVYVLDGTGVIELTILIIAGVIIYSLCMISIENMTSYEFTSIYYSFRQAL